MFETKGFWSISVDVSCLLLGESSHTHTHTHTLWPRFASLIRRI